MPYTQHRTVPWQEVFGADGEKIFAFGAQVFEQKTLTAGVLGEDIISGTAVPSGKVYVIQFVEGRNTTRNPSTIYLGVNIGGILVVASAVNSPGLAVWAVWNGTIIIKPGDYAQVNFEGTQVGDSLVMQYAGYSMTLP